ncbi:MAG: hypothetical protein COA66_10450 [Arcobacter sp.]|nr:MAG: hypothetical protein COA66_10450 [Arcobacter sp.]
MDKTYLYEMCKHEMGHYVVAKLLNFDVEGITLLNGYNASAHVSSATILLQRSLENIEQIKKYLEDRIIVLYAGVLSESLINQKINLQGVGDLFNSSGRNDNNKVNDLVQLYRNILYPNETNSSKILEQLKLINDKCYDICFKLVEEEAIFLENIAGEIFDIVNGKQTKSLSKSEIMGIKIFSDKFNQV